MPQGTKVRHDDLGLDDVLDDDDDNDVLDDATAGRVVEEHSEKLIKLLDHYVEFVYNKFNKYAAYFFCCELLNIIILVSQVRK